MTSDTAVAIAKDIAAKTLTPSAAENDRLGRFSPEAIEALGQAGLLGMMLPSEVGGAGLGPRTFADVIGAIAEADASVAMVFLMHTLGALTIAAAPRNAAIASVLDEIAAGRHLSTLAFSEIGSRSHFWAPVSRAVANGSGVRLTARKSFVTSAGYAQSYVRPRWRQRRGPTDSTLYLVRRQDCGGVQVVAPGTAWVCAPTPRRPCPRRLRRPARSAADDGRRRVQRDAQHRAAAVQRGTAAVALGICRAAVTATRRI